MHNIFEIQERLKKKQSHSRFLHTLGVQYTAASLAMSYGYDIHKAQLAGLLHDCAKHLSDSKKIKVCKDNKIPISEVEYNNPFLLHAQVGAVYAREKYGVTDNDILMAIRYHTTGRPEMSLLEKLVFVADYIEPNRKNAPNLDYLRRLGFKDIDRTILIILKQTLEYLNHIEGQIDESTVITYNYYDKLIRINSQEECLDGIKRNG